MLKFINFSIKFVIIFFGITLFFIFSSLWYFSVGLPDYKKLTNYQPPISSRVYSNDKKQLYSSFHSILREHGISLKKINSCTEETKDNKQKWDNILATRLDAQKKGVNSTPTFFLNGKKLEGLVNLEKIEQYIY